MATGDDRIGLLFWEMTLNDEEFNKKISSAEKNLNDIDDSGRNSLTNLASKFAGLAIGASAAVGGLTAFSVSQIEQITQTKILADSIGATTAEFEGLTIASERLVGDAGMVIDKMREFGGIDEFKALADDVKNAGDEAEQLAKAVELFGGEGAKMLPVLQLGSAGLKEFEEQALATGRALSPEETERAAAAYQDWNELVDVATGLTRKLGVALSGFIPILKEGVQAVSDMGSATDEMIDGLTIMRDEFLGLEDPFDKAVTAEEILAEKAKKATKELENQANAMKDLEDQTQETFSSDLFAEQAELDMLEELREELGLTEKGLSKIAGMATAAFGRGETVGNVADSVRELLALKSQRIFSDEDFQFSEKLEEVAKGGAKALELDSIFGDNDDLEADLNKTFDKQQERLKQLMQQQANAPQFAEMATAGSVAEFRILNQNDEKTQKGIENNTAKMVKQLERIKVG